MAVRIFDSETWRKIGQPDLGSKMFYIDKSTGKKVWGSVTEVQFGHKKGVKLKIKKFNK
jgi:ribosomal protein L35AE/L33A